MASKKENYGVFSAPSLSPAFNRKAARAQVTYERELERLRNRPSGVTRFEDQPRIGNYEERVKEAQTQAQTRRVAIATAQGGGPEEIKAAQEYRPSGMAGATAGLFRKPENAPATTPTPALTYAAPATGDILKGRQALAKALQQSRGVLNEDMAKLATDVGLRATDVAGFVSRMGGGQPQSGTSATTTTTTGGVEPATGDLLKKRQDFAEKLKTTNISSDILKEAAGLGLAPKDVRSYMQKADINVFPDEETALSSNESYFQNLAKQNAALLKGARSR